MNSPQVSFREALGVWTSVGLQSFGGPAGQIALMHRILVDERRWISEPRFLHALNFCMLLPGPEAQQLAIYVGWLLHGHAGGFAAGILFVLPGFLTILALSILYAGFHGVAVIGALLFGLKAAVLAVVAHAVVRLGRRVLRAPGALALAAGSFVAIYFLEVAFPLIILGAGLAGLAAGRFWPGLLSSAGVLAEPPAAAERPGTPAHPSLGIAALLLALWLGPVALLSLTLGPGHLFSQEGIFFSKVAVVTFGGAYAVLAYVAQEVVHRYEWLQPTEMLDGLGLAETTPGPLILVLQFIGFMAAFRHPGDLPPLLAGTLGAMLTAWVTFVPCFLMIFLGAPYVESARRHRGLNAALSAITAAVVGVVLNLGVWLSLHVLFSRVDTVRPVPWLRLLVPGRETLDLASLAIAVASCVAMFRYKAAMMKVLAGGAAAGMILGFFMRR